jgi:hypothetical protein
MKALPRTKNSPLLRTDFADESAWQALVAAVGKPVGDFRAYVTPVSDPAFDGTNIERLIELGSDAGLHFILVADRLALTSPEYPVLVVDVAREPGRTFRVVPSAAWSVENNLSLANMDFEEFADAVDEGGVFRGFPEG